jgi:hypothetical protein
MQKARSASLQIKFGQQSANQGTKTMLFNDDTFNHDGRKFKVTFPHDDTLIEPWKEFDGHGPVSEWTRRAKASGELVLVSDRGMHRYYDFAEAVKIAKRDGWDAKPYSDTETRGQKAAKAAMADYNHLRRYLTDQWHYVGCVVQLVDDSGNDIDESESLWGIESDDYEGLESVAHECASEIVARLETALSY